MVNQSTIRRKDNVFTSKNGEQGCGGNTRTVDDSVRDGVRGRFGGRSRVGAGRGIGHGRKNQSGDDSGVIGRRVNRPGGPHGTGRTDCRSNHHPKGDRFHPPFRLAVRSTYNKIRSLSREGVGIVIVLTLSLFCANISYANAEEIPPGYHLRYCHSPEKLKAEKTEFNCPNPGVTYLTYREDAVAVEDEWEETKELYTFIGSEGKKGTEVTALTIYGFYPSKYITRAWFYQLCEGNGTSVEQGGSGHCTATPVRSEVSILTEQVKSEGVSIFVKIAGWMGIFVALVIILIIGTAAIRNVIK